MKNVVTVIAGAAVLGGVFGWSAAPASPGKGPKMVEIDEAGNIRTTSGNEIGKKAPQASKSQPQSTQVPRDMNAAMSICDPRYRWSPSGMSADTVARTRAFYRDVTRKYEQAQTEARQTATNLSRSREEEFWKARARLLDSVPQNERKVVARGIEPRLSWWCNAPPVIVQPVKSPGKVR